MRASLLASAIATALWCIRSPGSNACEETTRETGDSRPSMQPAFYRERSMKRIGNARTISDIEFVIEAPGLGDSKSSWSAHGVECTRDRHRFSGQAYAFSIEIVQLRLIKSGRTSWHAIIVTEWWHSANSATDVRNSKWLKILSGKSSDVTAWMRRYRALKVEKSIASEATEK
jgi:hypothetical protein